MENQVSIRLSHDDRVGVKWKWTFGCFLSQRSHFLWVLVIEDDVQLAIREGGDHAVHEAEELDTAPPLGMLGDNPAAGDFERCKQGRGTVPLVIVALAGRGASVRELRSLAPAPTPGSKASHRRREQSPWQAGRYRARPRRPLSPRTQGHCSRTRTCGQPDRCVLAQKAPNMLNVNICNAIASSGPVQRRSPAAAAYPEAPECVCRRLTVVASCCPRRSFSPAPMIGKAMPPLLTMRG